MSHVTPEPPATSDTEPGPPTAAPRLRKHAPVLVTENQIAFNTAAAAHVPRTRHQWLDRTLIGRLGRIGPASLEAERMSRETDRLSRRARSPRAWQPRATAETRSAMTRLIGRAWVPIGVVTVGA